MPTDHSSEDSRRKCPVCNKRMSTLLFDLHSKCHVCRGSECSFDQRCDECSEWTEDFFTKYSKHRKSLESKSRKRKLKDTERSSSLESILSVLGTENVSKSSLDETQVLDIVQKQFVSLQDVLASSMRDSFIELDARIDSRISDRMSSNVPITDNPSLAQVQPVLSQGLMDTSSLTPRIQRKVGCEGERYEPELEELAMSPNMYIV